MLLAAANARPLPARAPESLHGRGGGPGGYMANLGVWVATMQFSGPLRLVWRQPFGGPRQYVEMPPDQDWLGNLVPVRLSHPH